jgi:D-alanyl-D-alanine carboxypeptidase
MIPLMLCCCCLTACSVTVSEPAVTYSVKQDLPAAAQTTAAVSVTPAPAQKQESPASKQTAVTAAKTAAATTAATAAKQENEDWMLRLANKTHPVGEYAPPELVTLKNGTQVDVRMYPALQKMYDDMRAQGLQPMTREAYRTYAAQQDIMESRIRQHRNEGKSPAEAKRLAEMYVALPGTSEHQLGLAVDINSEDGNNWNVYNWLAVHAHEYGFILRYPQGKEEITGFQYEAWHYRYVGKTAAEAMYKSGKTLEEYLGECS